MTCGGGQASPLLGMATTPQFAALGQFILYGGGVLDKAQLLRDLEAELSAVDASFVAA